MFRILEGKYQPLAPLRVFYSRLAKAFLATLGVIAFSLAMGAAGYHYFGHMGWLDAWLNASMILTGMGPVNELHTVGAKLFASFYALFSGVVFITSVALLLTPVIHRLLHKFHLEAESAEEDSKERRRGREK